MDNKDRLSDDPLPWDHISKVVDRVAYNEYLRLSRLEILSKEGRKHICSEGTVVDLSTPVVYFEDHIAHLPDQERVAIMGRKSMWSKMHGKLIQQKRKAFGTTNGLNGVDKKIQANVMVLEEKGREIRALYGKMFTPEEVQKIVVEEFKLPCTLETAVYFRKKHIHRITKLIENFKRDYQDMRLVHKRGRLEELTWLYSQTKGQYLVNPAGTNREYMLRLLEQLRKESEGDVLKIEGNLDMKIEATINHHMRNEVLAGLNMSQIIIARVASKMGIDPTILIYRLSKSAYSRFNGMFGDVKDAEYEEIKYPSSSPYEYDQIKQSYRIITKEEEEASAEIIQDTKKKQDKAASGDFKEKLQNALNQIRGDNKERSGLVDQIRLESSLKKTEDKVKKEREEAKKKLLKPKG